MLLFKLKVKWLCPDIEYFNSLFLDQTETVPVPVNSPFDERTVSGTLRQFIENAESGEHQKILRVVRMPSETSPSQTPFGSEFVAWRETKARVYCKEEDPSLLKKLLWYDITTKNSVQWWTLNPHGFGMYIDVCAGSQLLVIGTPPQDRQRESDQYFAQPRTFLPNFRRMRIRNNLNNDFEAIHLTEGMRMYVYSFTKYCSAKSSIQCHTAECPLCDIRIRKLHYNRRVFSFHTQHLECPLWPCPFVRVWYPIQRWRWESSLSNAVFKAYHTLLAYFLGCQQPENSR